MEMTVTTLVRSIGIQANLKGYRYLRSAIVCAARQPELLDSITSIYKRVAEMYNTDSCNVERAIRYAVELAYFRNPDAINNFFNYPVGKPTNSEVIALASDNIRIWADKENSRGGSAFFV
ncbi:MAG: sporulation initiation factor Spo0A C-terminal domain-containing protein [Ruminococcus sp.]|nr:sporulation initiation factor Spo0A C-terminal domain-containing protein [Ruminococcus sp.]